MPAAPLADAPPPSGGLRLPSLDALRAFEAAARLGTFERAADELAVTASAVAKRVATLEALLGTALFVRTSKALQPTAAGREYRDQVAPLLHQLAALPLHRMAGSRLQRLRVSAPPTFARQILVPALDGYTRRHPEVELEVVLAAPQAEDAAEPADLSVRHGPPGGLGGQVLMHERVRPLAAPALLQRLPPLVQPADLRHAPLLRTPIEPWRCWFTAAGLDWPEPAQGPRLVDLGLTLEAAAAGQGVALARPSLARAWLASGALVPVGALDAEPAGQYQLLQTGVPTAASQGFGQWLHSACQAAADAGLACLQGGGSSAAG